MTMQVPHPTSKPSVAPRRDRYQTDRLRGSLIFIPTLDSAKLEFTPLIPENSIKTYSDCLDEKSHGSSGNNRVTGS
nr:uncharacterized protein LOC117223959 [Megalopta genalis]